VAAEAPAGFLGPGRRVCVVCLGGLGDAVWGMPVVNALKQADPGCRITWIVEPLGAPLLEGHPSVDETIVFHRRRGWRGVLDLWRRLRDRRFDVTLNLYHLGKSIPPTLLSGAPRRIGFDRGRTRDWVWLASSERIPPAPRRHVQDHFLEFVDYLGVRDYRVEWRLAPSDAERQAQAEFFAPLRDRPVVALVPSSSKASKDWPAERYAEVVDALEHDFGFRTVLVGGPGEREGRAAREIASRASAEPVWALGDGVRRLVWLLGGSDLVIAPDTGPTHIARAMEVPVIGLYGHTNPLRVGPYRRFEELWVDRYTDPGETPDASHAHAKQGRMERITVRDVLERVERAARRYLPAGRPR